MRNTYKTILAMMAGAIMLGACSEKPISQDSPAFKQLTISVSQEDETKVSMDGKSILWSESDCISIFSRFPDGDNYQTPLNNKFTIENGVGNRSASFSGSVETTSDGYLAVYPYSAETVASNGGDNIFIAGWNAQTQVAVPGGIDPSKVLMGGYAPVPTEPSSQSFSFGTIYNLCSYVRFTTTSTCSRIEFKSNGSQALASVDVRIVDLKKGMENYGIHDYGTASNTISLVPEEEYGFISPGTYTIAVLPGTLPSGFTIIEYSPFNPELTVTKTTSKSVALKRNTILNLGTLDAGVNFIEDYIDLGLEGGKLWASCNLGASSPEQIGNYYAFGYTTPYTEEMTITYGSYSFSTAKADLDHDPNENNAEDWDIPAFVYGEFTEAGYGDAASVVKGEGWHIPGMLEASTLMTSCNGHYSVFNGVPGLLLVSKENGKSLFFPFAPRYIGGGNYVYDQKTDSTSSSNISHYWMSNACGLGVATTIPIYYSESEKTASGYSFSYSTPCISGLPIRACK